MKKFLVGFVVLVAALVIVARVLSPTPESAPSLNLQTGQTLTVTLLQKITGQSDTQPVQLLDGDYTVHETYTVTNVSSSGDITINVSVKDVTGEGAQGPKVIQAPPDWAFTVNSQGVLLSGSVWPALGASTLAPYPDDFCLPLPDAFNAHSSYSVPVSRSLTAKEPDYTLAVSIGALPSIKSVLLSATATYATTLPPTTAGAVTITSHTTVNKTSSCLFDASAGIPLSEQSQLAFTNQQVSSLEGVSQTVTTKGNLVTSITYSH